jgi:hypothetical protein
MSYPFGHSGLLPRPVASPITVNFQGVADVCNQSLGQRIHRRGFLTCELQALLSSYEGLSIGSGPALTQLGAVKKLS